MSMKAKFSHAEFDLPAPEGKWTWERRPGGVFNAEKRDSKGNLLARKKGAILEEGNKLWFQIEGRLWAGEVLNTALSAEAEAAGDADLIAQFPGKVRKVLVKEGSEVEEGDELLLVEAMKMEFSVKAPFAGKLEKIHVKADQQVSPGDRFLDLIPTEDA
jgi:biotin carboxyl carrier protein